MEVNARPAHSGDLVHLAEMYRKLEREMAALEALWPLTDGLAEPIEDAFRIALADESFRLVVGTIDEYPFGFLLGRLESMLPQAGGVRIGSIRLIFTDPEAREVGIGSAMVLRFLGDLEAAGISIFDAHVAPGHRLAKNFFEAHGFSARRIVMNTDAR